METREHPAKFSQPVIDELRLVVKAETERQGHRLKVLDPFAGIGRIHDLGDECETVGVELEPEWASAHKQTEVGDATALRFKASAFDVVATSPCLAQEHRILSDDLRWIPAGDVVVGTPVLAFDEHGPGAATGHAARRRWRRAEVIRSVPRSVECVRVILANGDDIVTTPEHPWLAYHYSYRGRRATWVASCDLMKSPWVQRQLEPWRERRSFDAGWLSGMFDGEGSLSLGVHGSPKMILCQADGPVADRAERLMAEFGYEPNRIWRTGVLDHRQKISNLYVTGGFPGLLRALGELRPTRLLDKWSTLDIATRTVQADRVEVLAVEPAGVRDIQEIETTAGTYFGEGYLHHNCYGNRMADLYAGDAKGSQRYTYRIALGREPSLGSSAGLQWGTEYRALHASAWREALRVLVPEGLLVVNLSNHVRDGKIRPVVEWHLTTLLGLGCLLVEARPVETQRMRNGANSDLRVDAEMLLVVRAPAVGQGSFL